MTFSNALEHLKQGKRVARSSWGGYWFISTMPLTGLERFEQDGERVARVYSMEPVIVAKLKTGGYAPATPYQADLLADDWGLVDADWIPDDV